MSEKITRRQALVSALAPTIAPSLDHTSDRSPGTYRKFFGYDTSSLAELAQRAGLSYGSAVRSGPLLADPQYRALVLSQCDTVTPEGELKWANVEKQPGVFTIERATAIKDIVSPNRIRIRGHALLWHGSIPDWLSRFVTNREIGKAAAHFEAYVQRCVSSFVGHASAWDVVNEALPKDGVEGHLRPTLFQAIYKDRFLDQPFWIARQADPSASLYYNDYGFEQDGSATTKKRYSLLRLVEGLLNRGVPITGVGLQAHLYAGTAFDELSYKQFVTDLADLEIDIAITELDVDDHRLPRDCTNRDEAVADIARRVLEVALDCPRVCSVSTWGITDRYTWMNDWGVHFRSDLTSARALPYDGNLVDKPLRNAIARTFKQATARVGHRNGI